MYCFKPITGSRLSVAVIFFASISLFELSAQQSQVLVHNPPKNTNTEVSVQVKWYSEDILYPEGVHVYRRASGALNWTRLTERPILQKETIDPAEIARDEELEFYVDLVKEQGTDVEEQILLLNTIIKSFQNEAFADFLGIFYRDNDVVSG